MPIKPERGASSLNRISLRVTLLILFPLVSLSGCGSDENMVIQPSGVAPTAEETAEYRREQTRMEKERD